jgi:hypothetical protein
METLKGQEWDQLQKDGKYLEVLVVSAGYEKLGEETGVVSGMPNAHQEEEAVELILRLAKEIIEI